MRSSLIKALEIRGIPFETSDSGEWVRFRCPHGGTRYVVHSRLADGYQSWCDADSPETLDWFPDAATAVAGRL